MELRQLKYFLSAARCLSFTRAAEECHIVQSAMSQQIRALEKELGVDLFERTRQGLRLTPEGEATVRESEALMERIQNLPAAVRSARHGAPAPLRLGVQGNILRETLPKALHALRSTHPQIAIQIRSDILSRLMTDMKEDRLDCVLAMAEGVPEGFEQIKMKAIVKDSICAMLPADSKLVNRKVLTTQSLVSETLILYTSELQNAPLNTILARGEALHNVMYVHSQNDIESLVAAGFGVSFCLKSAFRPHHGINLHILNGVSKAQLSLLWRKDCSATAQIEALISELVMASSKLNAVF